MSVSLMPLPKQQFLDSNGKPLSGGQVFTYQPGTVRSNATLVNSYTDSTGLTPNSNPVILDSAGRASIWLSSYVKVDVLDANSVVVYSGIDNVSSMPNTAFSTSEWVLQSAVLTYIGATQFSVPSDLTATFQVNRRIKAVVSAGTIYGTITVSSAGGSPVITTVTVVWDSGALDAGLSAVSVGIVSPTNSSLAYAKANGIATLNANSLVIQNPANANAAPTANNIPISDANGTLISWANLTPTANTIPLRTANKDLTDRNNNPIWGIASEVSNSSNSTPVLANFGTVTAGDRIFLSGSASGNATTTPSDSFFQVDQQSGSANIVFNSNQTNIQGNYFNNGVSGSFLVNMVGMIQVTANGTLIMETKTLSLGSNATLTNLQIYGIFIKKQ